MMTIEEKKEIKSKLPPKWVTYLATETLLSKVYIRKVMSGKSSHVLIEKKALELAISYQKELEDIEQLKKTIL